ncbi:hypothetical protein CAL7716_053420 [Calothrix sp. PCC 7716]|nr:hypothetical protein CAL7716_053420 [Calothrix sp. PCC 7716]
MYSELPENDPILKPVELLPTKKQQTIRKAKPWINSAVSRSKPMKQLRAYYYELYQRNIAEEPTEKPSND